MKKIWLIIVSIIIVLGVCFYVYYKSHICRASIYNESINFDGNTYEEVSGDYEETNVLICKSKDGRWSIYEVKGYKNHEYVILRSFLDQYLYKKIDNK